MPASRPLGINTFDMLTRPICRTCRAQLMRRSPSQRVPSSRRHQSSTLDDLRISMPARRKVVIHDDLSPRNSQWLNVALSSFVPSSWLPPSTTAAPTGLPPPSADAFLPPAHHLVYFNPAYPADQLLPDGTDPNQSPGPPFVRRMWAGGSVRWHPAAPGIAADGRRWACVEGIRSVDVKGPPGAERVFVRIERRFGRVERGDGAAASDDDVLREQLWEAREDAFGAARLVECRNIVFMRERSRAEIQAAARDAAGSGSGKLLKPTHPPAISHTLRPTPALLFRYSALSFNAHAIHLDPAYCRAVEAHRERLVHGPLSFTLLATMLQHHVSSSSAAEPNTQGGRGRRILSMEYRNLAPLYCGEPMKLCARKVENSAKDAGAEERFEVWAETPEGGMAVRGTATVG